MKNKTKLIYWLAVILIGMTILCFKTDQNNLQSVKNNRQLMRIYNTDRYRPITFVERMLYLPYSVFYSYRYNRVYDYYYGEEVDVVKNETAATGSVNTKDYSKTNIQVENVDEADIVKTDGDYLYSLSGTSVVITNVKDPNNIFVESTINNAGIPVDLILYKDKLVVISSDTKATSRYQQFTIVKVYDISSRKNPKVMKSFELEQAYYTTRCIDGRLYVFSNGYLEKEDNHILRNYKEDNKTKEIPYKNIKYLKNRVSRDQTIIAEMNLNVVDTPLKVSSYLIDISNAYISEENIYLADWDYQYDQKSVKDLFTWKGVFGLAEDYDYSYDKYTSIYKFHMDEKKGVEFVATTKVKGSVINQYSFDEKNNHFRIALETEEGTGITVLDENLKVIGESERVAQGERMYSSRFMNDKAYLVTYQNTDPLFVFDLSDDTNPTVLGELKVPGYSTYLHPYDEEHLIGIGMETEERITRDYEGKIISTRAVITGMKMSLFDVSDVYNPKQLAKTTIGDSRTVSAILTNPKALLFSKEKKLIAIPVNYYADDFTSEESESIDSEIDEFILNSKDYVSEGYFVYQIDLENGFQLKGVITHKKTTHNEDYYYYYSYGSRLLRGVYIENNLFTISEDAIKVNSLEDLTEISSLNLNMEGEN